MASLNAFRRGLYGCFGAWPDTLFELVDALAGASCRVRSLAELMFEPAARRGWGSLYQAVEHGRVVVERARDLLVDHVRPEWPLLFAIDTSTYPRPHTGVVPDVGLHYTPQRQTARGAPAVAGWSMQWVAQVGDGAATGRISSWALPVDVRRVGTADNANELAAAQVADVVARLRARGVRDVPLFLFDAGYCPIYLTQQLPAGAAILVRLRGDRVFFSRAPTPGPGQPGRPRKHGARFALDEPHTWGPPDAELVERTPGGGTVRTRAWHRKHPEPRPRRKWRGTGIVEGTLIRREETHPGGSTQAWWLWWAGPADAFDLPGLAGAYHHRFGVEHMFRFIKQELWWTGHTPLGPDQAERWSWLVLAAYAQLALARGLAEDHRLPWERRLDAHQLTPRRVRRVFRRITAALPTPARAPKPSRPGPGRPPGAKNKTRRRHQPVIKKGRPDNTGHPKGQSPRAKAA